MSKKIAIVVQVQWEAVSALKQSGQDVTLLDYWKDHVHRIRKKGIEVQTEK